jgi:hypothetical protein
MSASFFLGGFFFLAGLAPGFRARERRKKKLVEREN